MRVLQGLEPASVFEFFEDIPHGIQKLIVQLKNDSHGRTAYPWYNHRKTNEKPKQSAFAPSFFIIFYQSDFQALLLHALSPCFHFGNFSLFSVCPYSIHYTPKSGYGQYFLWHFPFFYLDFPQKQCFFVKIRQFLLQKDSYTVVTKHIGG